MARNPNTGVYPWWAYESPAEEQERKRRAEEQQRRPPQAVEPIRPPTPTPAPTMTPGILAALASQWAAPTPTPMAPTMPAGAPAGMPAAGMPMAGPMPMQPATSPDSGPGVAPRPQLASGWAEAAAQQMTPAQRDEMLQAHGGNPYEAARALLTVEQQFGPPQPTAPATEGYTRPIPLVPMPQPLIPMPQPQQPAPPAYRPAGVSRVGNELVGQGAPDMSAFAGWLEQQAQAGSAQAEQLLRQLNEWRTNAARSVVDYTREHFAQPLAGAVAAGGMQMDPALLAGLSQQDPGLAELAVYAGRAGTGQPIVQQPGPGPTGEGSLSEAWRTRRDPGEVVQEFKELEQQLPIWWRWPAEMAADPINWLGWLSGPVKLAAPGRAGQMVGGAMRAVDTAQNVGTWATAKREELPTMIAFAAVTRGGPLALRQLGRWWRGAPDAPLGQRLAVGLQAEWEYGLRQAGEQLPETIMVQDPQTGLIADVSPARVFREAGYELAHRIETGQVPEPGTAAARAWEAEVQRAGNTPQAKTQRAMRAFADKVDLGEPAPARLRDPQAVEMAQLRNAERDPLLRGSWDRATQADLKARAEAAQAGEAARSSGPGYTDLFYNDETGRWDRPNADSWRAQREADLQEAARGPSLETQRVGGEPVDFARLQSWWEQTAARQGGQMTEEQQALAMAYSQALTTETPWTRWPEDGSPGVEAAPVTAGAEQGQAPRARLATAWAGAPEAQAQRQVPQAEVAPAPLGRAARRALEHEELLATAAKGPKLDANAYGRMVARKQAEAARQQWAPAVDAEAYAGPNMTRLQAWFEHAKVMQGGQLTGEQEQAAMAYARGEARTGPWEKWPETQMARSANYDEVQATQWLTNMLEDYGGLTPEQADALYQYQFRDGPAPWTQWPEGLEMAVARQPQTVGRAQMAPQVQELTDEWGTYRQIGDAVDVADNWKRLQALPDDQTVILYHATSKEAAERILAEGYQATGTRHTDTPDGYVYLGGKEGLGTYLAPRGGKTGGALVAFRVRKGDLEPDAGSDWKGYVRSQGAQLQGQVADTAHPTMVDTYAQINQVRVRQENAQPIGIVDYSTGEILRWADQGAAAEQAEELIPVYRGTGPRGRAELRPSTGGVYGPGLYFYTRPQDAAAYASPGGGIVTGYVPKSRAIQEGNVVVVRDLADFERRGTIPTEETMRLADLPAKAQAALAETAMTTAPRPTGFTYDPQELLRGAQRQAAQPEAMYERIGPEPAPRPTGFTYDTQELMRRSQDVAEGRPAWEMPEPQVTPLPGGSLIAMHNLDEDALLAADALGGMPVPSIGITRKDTPYSGFGGITLIGTRQMIDPQRDPRNKVYDADIYSPTRPDEVWRRVPVKRAEALLNRLAAGGFIRQFEHMTSDQYQLWSALEDNPNRNKVLDLLLNGEGLGRLAFLHEQGVDLQPVRRPFESSTVRAEDTELLAYWREHEDELRDLRRASWETATASPLYQELSALHKAAWLQRMGETPGTTLRRLEQLYADQYVNPDKGGLLFGPFDRLLEDAARVARGDTVQDGRATDDLINAELDKHGGKEALKAWAHDLLTGVFDRPQLRLRGKLVEYNLANLVEAMSLHKHGEDVTKGGFMGTWGMGQARAVSARQYESIAEMHADEGRLASREAEEAYKKEVWAPALEAYQAAVEPYSTHGQGRDASFGSQMDAGFERISGTYRALGEYLKGGKKRRNGQRMQQALARNGFAKVGQEDLALALDAAEKLRDMPVHLFEAKLQRAVGISEFAGAAIPSNTGAAARAVLAKHHIPVAEFEPGDEEGRKAAIQRMSARPNALFEKAGAAAKPTLPGMAQGAKPQDLWSLEPKPVAPDLTTAPVGRPQKAGPPIPDTDYYLTAAKVKVPQNPTGQTLGGQIGAAQRIRSGRYTLDDVLALKAGYEAWAIRRPDSTKYQQHAWAYNLDPSLMGTRRAWELPTSITMEDVPPSPDYEAHVKAWEAGRKEREAHPWGDIWVTLRGEAATQGITDPGYLDRELARRVLRRAKAWGYVSYAEGPEADELPRYQGKLMALHNTREDKLRRALQAGGMPMPSIAVIRADQSHEDFGDISLVGQRELVDPEARAENAVFSADSWSACTPQMRYGRVTPEVFDAIMAKLAPLPENWRLQSGRSRSPFYQLQLEELESEITRTSSNRAEVLRLLDEGLVGKVAFLTERGLPVPDPVLKPITPHMAILRDHQDVYDWVKAHGQEVIDAWGGVESRRIRDALYKPAVNALADEMLVSAQAYAREALANTTEMLQTAGLPAKELARRLDEARASASHSVWWNLHSLVELTADYVELHEGDNLAGLSDGKMARLMLDAPRGSVQLRDTTPVTEWLVNDIYGIVRGHTEEDPAATVAAVTQALRDEGLVEAYQAWCQELLQDFGQPSLLLSDGRRLPYTLENMVVAMLDDIAGQQAKLSHTGGGQTAILRGALAQRFGSIEEMRAAAGGLVDEAGDKAGQQAARQALQDFERALAAAETSGGADPGAQVPWGDTRDKAIRILGRYIKAGRNRSPARMRAAFAKADFDPGWLTPTFLDKALDAAEQLRGIPDQYFEAKPARVVGFDEYVGAVLPDNTSDDVIRGLYQAGIRKLKFYHPWGEKGLDFGARRRALEEMLQDTPEALFEQTAPVAEGGLSTGWAAEPKAKTGKQPIKWEYPDLWGGVENDWEIERKPLVAPKTWETEPIGRPQHVTGWANLIEDTDYYQIEGKLAVPRGAKLGVIEDQLRAAQRVRSGRYTRADAELLRQGIAEWTAEKPTIADRRVSRPELLRWEDMPPAPESLSFKERIVWEDEQTKQQRAENRRRLDSWLEARNAAEAVEDAELRQRLATWQEGRARYPWGDLAIRTLNEAERAGEQDPGFLDRALAQAYLRRAKNLGYVSYAEGREAEQRKVYTGKLMAQHNMQPDDLQKALALGGLPMPSIAVMPAGKRFTEFGRISLIGRRELIDPARKDNAVFSADAYTPTVPANVWDDVELDKQIAIRDRLQVGAFATPGVTLPQQAIREGSELWHYMSTAQDKDALLQLLDEGVRGKMVFLHEREMPLPQIVLKERPLETPFLNNDPELLSWAQDNAKRLAQVFEVTPVQHFLPAAAFETPEGLQLAETVRQAIIRNAERQRAAAESPDRNRAGVQMSGENAYRQVMEQTRHFLELTGPGKLRLEEQMRAVGFTEGMDPASATYASLLMDSWAKAQPGDVKISLGDSAMALLQDIGGLAGVVPSTIEDEPATAHAITQAIRENGLEQEYQDWCGELLQDWGLAGVRVGKEILPATLENVVLAMRQRPHQIRPTDAFGGGAIRGAAAHRYRSLEEIRAEAGKLGSRGDEKAAQRAWEAVARQAKDAMRGLSFYRKNGHPYEDYERPDRVVLALIRYARLRKRRDGEALRKALEYYGADPEEITPQMLELAMPAAEQLYDLADSYVEAKPTRGVNWNEFVGAAVPVGTDRKLVQRMLDAGVPKVVYYGQWDEDKGDEPLGEVWYDREEAVDRLLEEPDAQFERAGGAPGGEAPGESPTPNYGTPKWFWPGEIEAMPETLAQGQIQYGDVASELAKKGREQNWLGALAHMAQKPEMWERYNAYYQLLYPQEKARLDKGGALTDLHKLELVADQWSPDRQVWPKPMGFHHVTKIGWFDGSNLLMIQDPEWDPIIDGPVVDSGNTYEFSPLTLGLTGPYQPDVDDPRQLVAMAKRYALTDTMPKWYLDLDRKEKLRVAMNLAGAPPIAPDEPAAWKDPLERDAIEGMWQRAHTHVDWWLLETARALKLDDEMERSQRRAGRRPEVWGAPSRVERYREALGDMSPAEQLQVLMYLQDDIPPLAYGPDEEGLTPLTRTGGEPYVVELVDVLERLKRWQRALDKPRHGTTGEDYYNRKARMQELADSLPWLPGDVAHASANSDQWRLAAYGRRKRMEPAELLEKMLPWRVRDRLAPIGGQQPRSLRLVDPGWKQDVYQVSKDFERSERSYLIQRLWRMSKPEQDLEDWLKMADWPEKLGGTLSQAGLHGMTGKDPLQVPGTPARAHEMRQQILETWADYATDRDKEDLLLALFQRPIVDQPGVTYQVQIAGGLPIPVDMADKADAVRARSQERLALANAPKEVRREAPLGVHSDASTGYVEGYETVDALQRYSGRMDEIMMRELLQNMVDASRGQGAGEVSLQLWSDDRILVAKDHGTGMTPEQVVNEFVKIGATLKPQDASGGKGSAKTALLGNADVVFMRTVAMDPATGQMMDTIVWGTGEEYLHKGAGLMRASFPAGEMPEDVLAQMPEVIADESHWQTETGEWRSGTVQAEIAREDAQWGNVAYERAWLQDFDDTQRLQNITVKLELNDQVVGKDPARRTPWEHVETISEGPVDLDIYQSPVVRPVNSINVVVLNHGLPQYTAPLWLGDQMDAPEQLVVDVVSHVSAQAREDPWTADRRGLQPRYEDAWQSRVLSEIKRTNQERQREQLRTILYDRAPEIVPAGPGQRQLRLVSEKDIPYTELEEMAARPYVQALARATDQAHARLYELLVQDSLEWQFAQGTSESMGLGLSTGWKGINIKTDALGGSVKQILVNPWAYYRDYPRVARALDRLLEATDEQERLAARQEAAKELATGILHTMHHEICHDRHWDHGAGHDGLVTALANQIGADNLYMLTLELADTIKAALASPADAEQYLRHRDLMYQARDKAGGGVSKYGSKEDVAEGSGTPEHAADDGGGEPGLGLFRGLPGEAGGPARLQPVGGGASLPGLPDRGADAGGGSRGAQVGAGAGLPGQVEGRDRLGGAGGQVGVETWSYGPEGTDRLQHRMKAVELADLVISHDLQGQENAAYPQELQPRDRSRQASAEWVQNTAPKLDPDKLLFDGHRLDDGPPIVNAQNQIESGNGRALALQLAARDYPQRYAAYRDALLAYADEYGLDRAALAGMSQPVLVRERVTPLADVPAYVDAANKPIVQARSVVEQARADARLIDDEMLAGLQVEGETDIKEALKQDQNKQVVHDFIKALMPEERNAMVTATGDLSPQGYERFMNALFTRTYRGKPGQALAGLLLESTDPGMKMIEKGLVGSLGPMAKAEGLMMANSRDATLSLAGSLSRTLVHLQELRKSKTPVSEYLNTRATFVGELNDFDKWLLELESRLLKSPTRLRDLLIRYAELVAESPDPRQGGLMGAVEIPPKEKLLERAITEVANARREDPGDWLRSEIPPDPGVLKYLGEDAEVRPDSHPLDKGRWAHSENWNAHVTLADGKLLFGQAVQWGERKVFSPGAEMDPAEWAQAGDVMDKERILREVLPGHMRVKARVLADLANELTQTVEIAPRPRATQPGPATVSTLKPIEGPAALTPGPQAKPAAPAPAASAPVQPMAAKAPQPAAETASAPTIKAVAPDGGLAAVIEGENLLIGHLVKRGGRQVMRPEVRMTVADWRDLAGDEARRAYVREQLDSAYKARAEAYVEVGGMAFKKMEQPEVKKATKIADLRLVGDRMAWRVEPRQRLGVGRTAASVIAARGDLDLDVSLERQLTTRAGSDLAWVTFSRETALQYRQPGDPEWTASSLGEGARLVATDGKGAYLVLLDRQAAAAQTPKPVESLTAEQRETLATAGYQDELLEHLTQDDLQTVLQALATDSEMPLDLAPEMLAGRTGRTPEPQKPPMPEPPTMAEQLPPDLTPEGLQTTRQVYYPRDVFKGKEGGRRSLGKTVEYAGMEIMVNRLMLDRLAQRGYTDAQIDAMWPEDVALHYTNDLTPERNAELAHWGGDSIIRYKDGPVDDLARAVDAIARQQPKANEKPDDWMTRLRTKWSDRLAPLEWLGKETGSDVYALGREVPGMAMRGESLLEQHVMPIIADLSPEELEELELWMLLWRMIDLRQLDPQYKLPAAVSNPRRALDQMIEEIGGAEGRNHPHVKKINSAAQQLWEVNRTVLLQRARDGGRISEAAMQVLLTKHPHYLPIYREGVPQDLDVFGNFTSAEVANLSENFIRHLSAFGSEKRVEDPLARWMTMLVKNEVDIARNDTAKEMIRALEQWQEAAQEQLVFRGDTPVPDSARVEWWEDGERQIAWIPTQFAKVAKALEKEPANIVTSMFTPLANVLRLGTTQLNLPFTVVNTLRDLMTAWYNEGLHPFKEEYWQGWAAALTHGELWHEAAQAGVLGAGMGDTFRNLKDIDTRNRAIALGVSVRSGKEALAIAPRTWEMLERIGHEAAGIAEAKRAGNDELAKLRTQRFWDDLGLVAMAGPRMIMSLNEVAETATRLAGYQHLKGKGVKGHELTIRAREITIDFAKAGTWMQMINRVVPFTNAQEQAAIKTWQVLKRDPKKALLASIPFVAASVLIYYWNKRFESSQGIPDYEYLYNWPIVIGETELPPDPEYPDEPVQTVPVYLRIPKGPIAAAMTALPEALLRIAYAQGDRTALEHLANAVKAMAESLSPVEINATLANPLPGFGSVADVLANRNLFTGREIVPSYERTTRPPELQYGPETSDAVVGIVTAFDRALGVLGIEGLSPRVVDYLIRANTGGTGEQVLWLMDLVANGLGYQPDAPGAAKRTEQTAAQKLTTNPFTKRFVGMRGNESTRVAWEDVDKQRAEIQRAYYKNAEVKRFGIGTALPGESISIEGVDRKLTPTQRGEIMARTAELAIPALDKLVQSKAYKTMSDADKEAALRAMKSKLQAYAREETAAEIVGEDTPGEDLGPRWQAREMGQLVTAWEQYQAYQRLDPSAIPLTAAQEAAVAEAERQVALIKRQQPGLQESQVWLAYLQAGGSQEAMGLIRARSRAKNPERDKYLREHPLMQQYGYAR